MIKTILKNTIIASIIISNLQMYYVLKKQEIIPINPPQKIEVIKEVFVEAEPKIVTINCVSDDEELILTNHKERVRKTQAMIEYLKTSNASEDLINLTPLLVDLCYLYDIDPFRPLSIIIHETGFGKSNAFREKNNVAGLNWTYEQKKKIGIKSNVYNLAVEKTLEASVTNLVMLLVKYKNFEKPLITLTQIQTKYAPTNDSRNGLDGVSNNSWTRDTIKHYKNIEALYLNKKQTRRC